MPGVNEMNMWNCPRCGRPFANQNQRHSCVVVSVAEHFNGRPPRIRELFEQLAGVIQSCGPSAMEAVKSRISFKARMTFASVYVRGTHLDVGLVLMRRPKAGHFQRIEKFGTQYVATLRVTEPGDLDESAATYIAEAYKVGTQETQKALRVRRKPAGKSSMAKSSRRT